MMLKLTPKSLAAAYEYLRAEGPLSELGLPHARKIKFSVKNYRDRFSHMIGYRRSKDAEIAISERYVGSSLILLSSMSHEQIHLYQHREGTETPNTHHNAEFEEIADRVCEFHHFDRKTF